MSLANLRKILNQADATDMREGQLAYARYNQLLKSISARYRRDFLLVTAAFVALSPNNDYMGNLRSLISILEGMKEGIPRDRVTVSTYKACRDRAWSYLVGDDDFLTSSGGPKTRAFFHNITRPALDAYVTIDGHMVGAYRDNAGTMKDNIIRNAGEYHTIAGAVKALAGEVSMIPNQVQAIIWFTRKRLLGVKYDAQLDLFSAWDDKWKTLVDLDTIRPYEPVPVDQWKEVMASCS